MACIKLEEHVPGWIREQTCIEQCFATPPRGQYRPYDSAGTTTLRVSQSSTLGRANAPSPLLEVDSSAENWASSGCITLLYALLPIQNSVGGPSATSVRRWLTNPFNGLATSDH